MDRVEKYNWGYLEGHFNICKSQKWENLITNKYDKVYSNRIFIQLSHQLMIHI